MAYLITLGELVASSQQLANQANGQQLDGPEWKSHISTRYGRIHTTVADTGARCFEAEATVNLANLALPSDHRSSIGVDFVIDASGRRRELPEIMIEERNVFTGVTGEALGWALSGTSLQLFPTPTSGTYKHLYVPQPTRYNTSSDATQIDVLTSDGLDAIIWSVASIALHRAESAQQRAIDEADAAFKRLKEWAVARSLTMPKRQVITSLNCNRGDIHGAWNPASWMYR
jgi:hypothetical protein